MMGLIIDSCAGGVVGIFALTPAHFRINILIQHAARCASSEHPGAWRKTAMSIPKMHAPSGRAAVANGARSSSDIAARSASIAPAFSASLTPARWPAKMIVRKLSGLPWVGGCVLARNTAEHAKERLERCNCTAIRLVLAVPRFWGDTHMRVRTRTYMREAKAGTREHFHNLYRLQGVECSFAVLRAFSPRTRRAAAIGQLGARHILAGGNARGAAPGAWLGPIRGQNVGTGGDSFRVFGGAAGPIGLELVQLAGGGRNGGFLRFSRASIGRVGRIALEGRAQGAVSSALSGAGRKPSRLRRVPWAAPRPRCRPTPPMPPAPSSDPLACRHARLAGFGSGIGRAAAAPAALNVSAMQGRGLGRCAKVGAGTTGRGGVRALNHAAKAATGRGDPSGFGRSVGIAPGRTCNASAGGLRVN